MGYVLFGQFGLANTPPAVLDVATLLIGYTGEYTDQANVVMSGKAYRLLTLTSTGTLTLAKSVKADIWMCAGGNGGRDGAGHGGGGGNFIQENGLQLKTSTVCVVGAGSPGTDYETSDAGIGGTTIFGTLEAVQITEMVEGDDGKLRYASACGASGGGASRTNGTYASRLGFGCGMSTVPFLETSMFDPHSAGGGGGGRRDRYDDLQSSGGSGGSDGSDGGTYTSSGYNPGAAGEKGGGAGGKGASSSSTNKGADATFYGSGGGGGGLYVSTSEVETVGKSGAGYQGVIYVRIPYEQ